MSWKDNLGKIRLLGPDEPEFDRLVKQIWVHIEQLEHGLREAKSAFGYIAQSQQFRSGQDLQKYARANATLCQEFLDQPKEES